jgi:type IV pilus assembly protein PilA
MRLLTLAFLLRTEQQYKLTNNEQSQRGFTLIELLVVVIIIGILSGIALPSMLSQARKAREASVQNDLGAVSRSQQAYRLEYSEFASDVNNLSINAPTSSNGYTYALGTTNATLAEFKATPSSNELRAFTGCATASSNANITTTSTSIEEAPPGSAPPSC